MSDSIKEVTNADPMEALKEVLGKQHESEQAVKDSLVDVMRADANKPVDSSQTTADTEPAVEEIAQTEPAVAEVTAEAPTTQE
jgi:hypothetical protein